MGWKNRYNKEKEGVVEKGIEKNLKKKERKF